MQLLVANESVCLSEASAVYHSDLCGRLEYPFHSNPGGIGQASCVHMYMYMYRKYSKNPAPPSIRQKLKNSTVFIDFYL